MEFHMTAQKLGVVSLSATSNDMEEEYSIPLNISDIIVICREFNKLGWQIQAQVENILEVGMEESIRSDFVKKESLPHIKSFLQAIIGNAYFGDAVSQAQDCIELIQKYEGSLSSNLN
jgi:hypothetical protein